MIVLLVRGGESALAVMRGQRGAGSSGVERTSHRPMGQKLRENIALVLGAEAAVRLRLAEDRECQRRGGPVHVTRRPVPHSEQLCQPVRTAVLRLHGLVQGASAQGGRPVLDQESNERRKTPLES